jgi:outer membrane receptor protein involved in Fe transport
VRAASIRVRERDSSDAAAIGTFLPAARTARPAVGVNELQEGLTWMHSSIERRRFGVVDPGEEGMRMIKRIFQVIVTAAIAATAHTGREALAQAAKPAAPTVLPEVEVTAAPGVLLGDATTASEGTVGQREIESRPSLRPADVLELVPGVIVTQHSGAGKANQYFLRGFNLDHGTDFLTRVMGMQVNFPTHAHGQGYMDLNFMIPELIQRLDYRKGPYFADVGDFSSAGSADIDYFRRLPQNFALGEVGNYGYGRALVAASPQLGPGNLLVAGEWVGDDGPWELPQNYRKLNGVLSYSVGTAAHGWQVTGMAYSGKWDSTDQVPLRAIDSGEINRFGAVDTSDRGESERYSLSGRWGRTGNNEATRAGAYFIDYKLDLWSNFTYFLNDPVNGDQFQQTDRRKAYGLDLAQDWSGRWGTAAYTNTIGLQGRYDDIPTVGLYLTRARERLSTIREDSVKEWNIGVYAQNDTRWNDKVRTVLGLRWNYFDFDVRSDLPENSGKVNANLLSPKAQLVLGPWARTEYYLSYGQGFHSNDARGVTTRVNPDPRDPAFLQPVEPVTPLVKTTGYEAGLRSIPFEGFQTTLAVFNLDVDSELLFIGDAGTTEASRPSKRYGVEWYGYYTPRPWLAFDLLAAYTRARFTDDDPVGDYIPGAIQSALAGGVTVFPYHGWFGSLRVRYFGERPLVEDNSVRSSSSTLWNLRAGYQIKKRVQVAFEVINLFDAKVSDIDYFYESRLANEVNPVADIHTHPAVPRTYRLAVKVNF